MRWYFQKLAKLIASYSLLEETQDTCTAQFVFINPVAEFIDPW
jgi:hypothetical protein